MSITKMTWTAQSAFRRRKGIDTNPDYQRPAVWTRAQKQLLIDSMLREYDVPKFYLHRTGKDTYAYDMTSFKLEVNVAVNHVFLSWVFGFSGKVKIKGPENVLEEYKDMVQKVFASLQ